MSTKEIYKDGENEISFKDGIIYIYTKKHLTEEDILILLDRAKEILKSLQKQPKFLIVNLMAGSVLRSYLLRRKVGQKFKEMTFTKGAVCEESFFSRTVASFIIVASGIKNVKVFKDRDKALSWLR